MTYKERLLRVLRAPHVSEKVSFFMKNNSTVVLKVDKNANKIEIKNAAKILFGVEVKKICTLIVKGKAKRHSRYSGYRKNWKKAYITLSKGQDLNFISSNTK